jgi:hypothetical protein
MKTCEVCGNAYDKAFTVTLDGRSHTFDSFECAIHALAPECSHCGCGTMFCCAHCAKHAGVVGVADRA